MLSDKAAEGVWWVGIMVGFVVGLILSPYTNSAVALGGGILSGLVTVFGIGCLLSRN